VQQQGCREDKRLYVHQKDIRRYEALQMVVDESLTLAAAAPTLGVSYRQAKRLTAREARPASRCGGAMHSHGRESREG